jgi:ATP-dependent DNA ligase
MLARVAAVLPEGADFLFEPMWDGFHAIVFRHDGQAQIQSCDLRSLNRYFPNSSMPSSRRCPRAACWTAKS